MSRKRQDFSLTETMPTTILLSCENVAGSYISYDFINGSLRYLGKKIKNSFDYIIIDNIGIGKIRIAYNQPSLLLSSSIDGSKTLKSGDIFYIEDTIWHINIYFIEDSNVEIVLKSDKDI